MLLCHMSALLTTFCKPLYQITYACACTNVTNGPFPPPLQREVEVDVPAIDPSKPVHDPPCPLDRRAPVRMSFRVSSKAVGKESRYEYLRRKLSTRRQQCGDADDSSTANHTSTRGKGRQQGSIYPETGERKAYTSSITGSRRPQYAAVKSPRVPLFATQQLDGGTLSQPAYVSCDYHSQATQRRMQRKVSPLAAGQLPSPSPSERSSRHGHSLVSQSSRESSSDREGRWQRASSAAIPIAYNGNNISPQGRIGARTSQRYARTNSVQPSYFQGADHGVSLSYYSPASPSIMIAPHLRRENQMMSSLPPNMDIYSRSRHVSSSSEPQRERRRHRSQSPGNFLSRSHNEHRYCQGRVRSQSSDRCLDEGSQGQLNENQRRRTNSVDFDLLSPVDNTYRVSQRRVFRNSHELLLVKQNRGGSTYTTATSEYVRKPRRKNATMSQSTEHLDQYDNKMEVVAHVNPPEDDTGSDVFSKQMSPKSIFARNSSEVQQQKYSTDSGYTSPTELGHGRGLRENTGEKEYNDDHMVRKVRGWDVHTFMYLCM